MTWAPRWSIRALVLTIALLTPGSAGAQLGGLVDIHTGSVDWDQADANDALLDGAAEANYSLPVAAGLRGELLGEFGVLTGPGEAAVRWDLGARFHTTGPTGFWLGGAIGAAGTGSPVNRLTRLEGGVRRSLGPARIDVWLSRTGFGGRVGPSDGLGQDTTGGVPDTLRRRGLNEYTDLGSLVTLAVSRYEVGLALTHRLGAMVGRRTGWELSGTWWMAPRIGLVGSTGHSLPHLGWIEPGRRYGTVGLRLALGAGFRRGSADESGSTGSVTRPSVALVERRLSIRSAPARTAEVMGDFTNWEARALTPAGAGHWILADQLSPGVHQLNVRFNGGPWLVPAGAFAMDDGFGGRVGMIVVR